ncbi:HNH endonuclease [Bifidobacterium castoris]|uniref:HNH endonuclease n=1 Tax=Bifidobacterium castoris TaxID=2306972 RepID=UPI0019D146F7|nr:HNH endonuclease [Bifidobacterium castoris]
MTGLCSLLGVDAAATAVLFLGRVRARVAALEDAPEYASDVSLNPYHALRGHVAWPHWAWASGPWVWPAVALCAAMLLLWAARRIPMRAPRNPFERDPRRRFTRTDRDWVSGCAGGRCEHRMLFGLLRCRRAGEQMDHHYPWSRGGATSRRNLVWLCARHNNRKSDRVPSRFDTWALVRARERYWPVWARGDMVPDGMCETDDAAADGEGPDMGHPPEPWPDGAVRSGPDGADATGLWPRR